MEVLTPRTLEEALELKAERPDAVPIQGGTDVMVELNFDRARPEAMLNLNEVAELRGWSRDNGSLRLGAGLTYAEAMEDELAGLLPALAEASRTVGSPQIRNRGTIGGNLGTASPAGDALPPLLVEGAELELAKTGSTRTVALSDFLVGPKQNALAGDELIVAVRLTPSQDPPDVHEGRAAQRDGDRRRARSPSPSTGSARRSAPRSARPAPCPGSSSGLSASVRSFRSASPPPRARSTTSAAPPPTAAMPSGC